MTHPLSRVESIPGAHGVLRALLSPFVQPSIFDFWAGLVNPAWSWNRPLARVTGRRVEARDTVTLTLAPNRHCPPVQPGQHINVSAEIDGRRTTRSYSMSNVPGRDRRIEITVKRVEGGKLSTYLCQKAGPGNVIGIGSAFGEMAFPVRPEGRWLFLAAGSGITPLMSLTRALARQQMPVALTLFYWARTRADLCFAEELHALAGAQPNFRFVPVLTREAELLPGELRGRLHAGQLPPLAGCQVRACGPRDFVELARSLCAPEASDFRGESFTPPPQPSTADAPAVVRVSLARSGRVIELPTDRTLLAGLEAHGMKPAHGCRMGICRSCVCPKLEGISHDLTTGRQDGGTDPALRLCVSQPRSPLTLDL